VGTWSDRLGGDALSVVGTGGGDPVEDDALSGGKLDLCMTKLTSVEV